MNVHIYIYIHKQIEVRTLPGEFRTLSLSLAFVGLRAGGIVSGSLIESHAKQIVGCFESVRRTRRVAKSVKTADASGKTSKKLQRRQRLRSKVTEK